MRTILIGRQRIIGIIATADVMIINRKTTGKTRGYIIFLAGSANIDDRPRLVAVNLGFADSKVHAAQPEEVVFPVSSLSLIKIIMRISGLVKLLRHKARIVGNRIYIPRTITGSRYFRLIIIRAQHVVLNGNNGLIKKVSVLINGCQRNSVTCTKLNLAVSRIVVCGTVAIVVNVMFNQTDVNTVRGSGVGQYVDAAFVFHANAALHFGAVIKRIVNFRNLHPVSQLAGNRIIMMTDQHSAFRVGGIRAFLLSHQIKILVFGNVVKVFRTDAGTQFGRIDVISFQLGRFQTVFNEGRTVNRQRMLPDQIAAGKTAGTVNDRCTVFIIRISRIRRVVNIAAADNNRRRRILFRPLILVIIVIFTAVRSDSRIADAQRAVNHVDPFGIGGNQLLGSADGRRSR